MALKWLPFKKRTHPKAPERAPLPEDHTISAIEQDVLRWLNQKGEASPLKPDEFRQTHAAICSAGFLPEAERILYALKGVNDPSSVPMGAKAYQVFHVHNAQPDHLRADFDALGPLAQRAIDHIGDEKAKAPLIDAVNKRHARSVKSRR